VVVRHPARSRWAPCNKRRTPLEVMSGSARRPFGNRSQCLPAPVAIPAGAGQSFLRQRSQFLAGALDLVPGTSQPFPWIGRRSSLSPLLRPSATGQTCIHTDSPSRTPPAEFESGWLQSRTSLRSRFLPAPSTLAAHSPRLKRRFRPRGGLRLDADVRGAGQSSGSSLWLTWPRRVSATTACASRCGR
jgi:hypothetical protein